MSNNPFSFIKLVKFRCDLSHLTLKKSIYTYINKSRPIIIEKITVQSIIEKLWAMKGAAIIKSIPLFVHWEGSLSNRVHFVDIQK